MSEFSFLLNQTTADYQIDSNGRIILSQGTDPVRDRIYTRLYTELGEWYLNNTVGVPYYGDDGILGSKKQADEIGALLRAQILDVDGVVRINTFQIGVQNRIVRAEANVAVSVNGVEESVQVSI